MRRALCFAVIFWPAVAAANSADDRARDLVARMTQDEKLAMLHGPLAINLPAMGWVKPPRALGSAGFVPGVPRLGIPDLQETDASLGITNPFNARPGDTAVALPSGAATAATFNPDIAYRNGAVLGREAAARGLNVVLGGGINLAREPRGGRDFEYGGEDPLLAGTMIAAAVRGTQDQHVVSTVKHFAANDQETGRNILTANIYEADLRESDLLAFEIAITQGHPGSVMCAYNRINTIYACENDYLLNTVLKGAWAFPGWVMSDWGAVHGAGALNAGLDQESGEQLDSQVFFAAPLRQAVQENRVPQSRVDDAVRRILRSMITAGLLDHLAPVPLDIKADTEVARLAEAQAIVLLRNENNLLPLARTVPSIAVIGGNADAGVAAGGGSSMVTPIGGFARQIDLGRNGADTLFRIAPFDPPSPLAAIQAAAPAAKITYTDGRYPSQAAQFARTAQVAIVFVTQWAAEASDIPDLSLPDNQDSLIDQVAQANPNTIVVMQTAGPVLMPWRNKVAAVLEAWYPGQGGAGAIAGVLFGSINPSGHLPVTFPATPSDLPNPVLPGSQETPGTPFTVTYPEGADAGYRWFARTGRAPLYPFGFGLSYTSFAYSGLTVSGGATLHITFDVKNTGQRAGMATPQAYLIARGGRKLLRLIGWSKPLLQPGETRHVALMADPRLLADFDAVSHAWRVDAGSYDIAVGSSATDFALRGRADVTGQAGTVLPAEAPVPGGK